MSKTIKTVPITGVDVEKLYTAYGLILHSFSSPIKNTYFRGKTEFRDFLYDKLGCSLLEAETLIDALENNGMIKFQRFRRGERYGFWEIH
jgi:hypothetical protein